MVRTREFIALGTAKGFAWLTERLYQELAWAYDVVAWMVSLGRWSGWRHLALAHVAGEPILELGFGTGELLLEMSRRGWNAVGLDRSPEMHRVTARKARRAGVSLPRVMAEAQALPFASGSFGTVVSTFPAGYILSPLTMSEVARVLAPEGGRFVVGGLYVESSSPFLRLLAWLVSGSGHQAAVEHFEAAAANAGLTVRAMEARGRGFVMPVFVLERRRSGVADREGEGAAGESDRDDGRRRR